MIKPKIRTQQKHWLVADWIQLVLMILVVILHGIAWMKGASHVVSGDAHDIWQEGVRIAQGENPYGRTLGGDMLHNDNYPTYLGTPEKRPTPYLAVTGI